MSDPNRDQYATDLILDLACFWGILTFKSALLMIIDHSYLLITNMHLRTSDEPSACSMIRRWWAMEVIGGFWNFSLQINLEHLKHWAIINYLLGPNFKWKKLMRLLVNYLLATCMKYINIIKRFIWCQVFKILVITSE